jgi:hypothetical protein
MSTKHTKVNRRAAVLGACAAITMATAAASGASAATAPTTSTGWGAYGAETVTSGSFTVAPDGAVSGTLPPGYTKRRPPVDAAAPETAAKIQAASASKASGLKTSSATAAAASKKVKAHAADNNPEGCVTAFSYISGGLFYKGQMAGCAYGNPLWLHTYLNADGTRVQDGSTLNCYSSTSCSVPYDGYTAAPHCRQFVNYAHGINRTTGGDSTAWQVHSPWAC